MTRTLCRFAVVVIGLALGGCKPAPEVEGGPASEGPPAKAPETCSIDYANWPQLTAKPIQVTLQMYRFCQAPDPAVEQEAKKLGPHAVPAIRVFANPLAYAHLRDARPGVLPVGSAIVKEKLELLDLSKPPAKEQIIAYAAMIKRDPGYDPANGDWEYVYQPLGGEGKAARGKLGVCIDCHRQEVAKDYLFRKYDK